MHKLSRLIGLSWWQWRVLANTPWALLRTWSSLRLRGYGKTLAAMRPARPSELSADQQLGLARETAYAVAVAIKYGPWRPLCLLRSLVLGRFLGRKGIPFEVRIGVPGGKSVISANGNLDFTAHAWVEHAGVVLNDKQDIANEFAPFDA
jgi:hypothetical protein